MFFDEPQHAETFLCLGVCSQGHTGKFPLLGTCKKLRKKIGQSPRRAHDPEASSAVVAHFISDGGSHGEFTAMAGSVCQIAPPGETAVART